MILDALKRAERERKLEKAPDLSAIYQEEGPVNRKTKLWFWLGGAFLVAFMALAIVFWPKAPSKPDLTASTPAKASPTGAAVPQPAARKTDKKAPPPAAALSVMKKQLKTQKKAAVSEKLLAVAPKEPKQPPVSAELPAEKMPVSRVVVAPLPKEDTVKPEPAPEPVLEQPAVSPVAEKRSEPVEKAIPETKPKEALPLFNDLSDDIQSVSGPLEINVHMYSSKPSERRVFINMQGYREGDVIGESGYKLVEITSNGVVIDYGKGKALLKVSRK